MKKILKFILITILTFALFIVIWATTISSVKHVIRDVLVENFKSRATLDEEASTKLVKYYKIESDEGLDAFITYGNTVIPGAIGDTIVSCESLMYVTSSNFLNSIITGIIGYYAGGHASIVTDKYYSYEIGKIDEYMNVESTGMGSGDTPAVVSNRIGEWNNISRKEVYVLRSKLTDEERRELVSMATSIIGDSYNYSFIFDIDNSSYCSDLVSKCYSKVGKKLNRDSFATTIYDIIVSSDMYLSYYHYFDSDGVKHIYYLA